MNPFQAIFLGIIEGMTEFLPISSTAHLIIAEKLLNIKSPSSFFTIVIQIGSIMAAVFFYRSKFKSIFFDTLKLAKKGFSLKKASRNELLGLWILISIIPTIIIGFIFRKQVDEWQNSIWLVAVVTILFGVIFYLIENFSKKIKVAKIDMQTVSLKQLVIMGVFQGLSIVPGVSRSGVTIATGLAQNVKMSDSIELSFLMGVPVIFIAALYKLASSISGLDAGIIFMTFLGLITSFIVGLYSIKIMLGILSKKGFYPFMIYRVCLGVSIIIFILLGIIK